MLSLLLLWTTHLQGFVSVSETANLPQENCSWGFTLGDYDADGDPDVYMHSHIQGLAERDEGLIIRSHLLRNEGEMRFTDVTEEAGLDLYNQDPHHASFRDYDQDGDLDLYVQMGTPKDHGRCMSQLWEQQEGGRFTEVAEARGLQGVGFRGRGASWADMDLDGDLDLYGPGPLASESGHKVGLGAALYRNNGEGPFTELGEEAGVGRYDIGGFQSAFGDFDGDRRPDLVVTWPLTLYWNLGDEVFVDITASVGLPTDLMARSATWIDYDQDGDLDLLATVNNIDPLPEGGKPGLRLYHNENATFTDVTELVGLDARVLARGATWGDVDNDGDLDLFVSELTRYRPDRLFIQGPDRRFTEQSEAFGLGATHAPGRSDAAFADFDGDGRLDLLIAQGAGGCYDTHGAPDLYRNTLPAGGYLQVGLQGVRSNRDALGAVVLVKTPKRLLVQYHLGPQHYLSQDHLPLHFGVADDSEISWVEVHWPNGGRERFPGPAVNSRVRLVEGQGTAWPTPAAADTGDETMLETDTP